MFRNQSFKHRELRLNSLAGSLTARRHDTLETLEPIWRMLETKGLATAFQQFDWVRTMKEDLIRQTGAQPFVVEVNDAQSGEIRMLLPFILIRKATHSIIEYMGLGVCDISAPLLAPNYSYPEEAGEALWTAIAAAFPKADLVHIDQIATRIHGHINPLAALPAIRPIPLQSFDVVIDGDPETIVDRLANNQTRRILKTSARRMAERGDVRFLTATTKADLDELLPVMIAQRLERFRGLGRFDLLADPHVQSFYKNAAIASLDGRGPVRVFGLSVGGEWIATVYGLVHAGTFHLTIITMASGDWQACSPGMATIAQFIRWSRQAGLTMIDFSVGEMAYKTGFGAHAHDLYAVLQPLTIRGRLVVAIRDTGIRLRKKMKAHPTLFRYLQSAMQFYRRKRSSLSVYLKK